MPRISSLTSLTTCPGLYSMQDAQPHLRAPGEAADTGTAVGRMVELWEHGRSTEDAIHAMSGEAQERCPLYNHDKAAQMFRSYASDPRNQPDGEYGNVIPESLEAEVTATLKYPFIRDELSLIGHMDQCRALGDDVFVWDVKTGGRYESPASYVPKYVWQLAGYAVALHQTQPKWLRGRQVYVGGIILLSQYPTTAKARVPFPRGVFQSLGIHDIASCEMVLESAAWMVSYVRGGIVPIFPGAACAYCPGGSAPGCLQMLGD